MTWFTARNTSVGIVDADRKVIWDVLTDPVALAKMTPYLDHVAVDGDRWQWNLAKIPVLGVSIAPSFTVVMEMDAPQELCFRPAPDVRGERTAADGQYLLEEVSHGTRLSIRIKLMADLPLPKLAEPAVRRTMEAVIAHMGKRYGDNLVASVSR